MKICILGCKSTTRHLLRTLSIKTQIHSLITISPDKGKKSEVADYDDLRDMRPLLSGFRTAERYDLKSDADRIFFETECFDVAFVAGWQRLLPESILNTLRVGAFGMHGSSQDLPKGRGRSPMNWSILEGRQWFYSNLFRYLPGTDDGPVLDTMCFSIQPEDTAETLHFKNLLSMLTLIERNLAAFQAADLCLKPQANRTPTYYPKRNPADGRIDWNDQIFSICALVRAVGSPFAGAFGMIGAQRLTIKRAAVFYTDLEQHPFTNTKNGTICDVFPNGKFLVRCNGGVLLAHEFTTDLEYRAIQPGQSFDTDSSEIKRFPRNVYGFFDMDSHD